MRTSNANNRRILITFAIQASNDNLESVPCLFHAQKVYTHCFPYLSSRTNISPVAELSESVLLHRVLYV